jgi:hypothetical protein
MRTVGFILLIVGFLGGSLAASADKDVVYWGWFLAAVAVGVAGVVLMRLADRSHTHAVEQLASNMQNVEASLRRIVEKITELNRRKLSLDPYDMRFRIDELFPQDLSDFVCARRSIAHAHGLAAYADVMSDFAAGERYLNRVWSASADGYIDEVNAYLDKAQEQFAAGLDKVLSLQGRPRDGCPE